jgi:hypothetical protein
MVKIQKKSNSDIQKPISQYDKCPNSGYDYIEKYLKYIRILLYNLISLIDLKSLREITFWVAPINYIRTVDLQNKWQLWDLQSNTWSLAQLLSYR